MYFPNNQMGIASIFPLNFEAVRVFGKTLGAARLEVKICLTPAHVDKRTADVLEDKAHEGIQRLNFWRDTILDDLVMIDINSELFEEIAGSVENTTMFCPGPPTDHLIVELLHAKISAICKGMFDIHAVSIKSTDTEGIETAYNNALGYTLPGIEYFPEEALHPVPWWHRDTIEVCDFVKGSVLEDELFNHFSDFFGKEKEQEADIIIFRADDEDNED